MNTIKFTHRERFLIKDSGVFNGVITFEEFENAILRRVEELYPFDTDEDRDPDSDVNESRNNLKGMSLEILWEFIVIHYGNNPVLGFKSSQSTSADKYAIGIDREDIMLDDSHGATQVKFQSRIDKPLGGKLFSFLAVTGHRQEIKHITVVTNILNGTSIDGIPENRALSIDVKKILDGNPGINYRVFGREQLINLCNIDSDFWDTLRLSLALSCEKQHRGELQPMWAHQEDALIECKKILDSTEDHRGQVVIPTGGGKTRIEWEISKYVFDLGCKIVVVFAPWIDLLKQHRENFHDFGDAGWNVLNVRSGDQNDMKQYTEQAEEHEPTTTPASIAEEIKKSLSENKPLVIFSTYKSAHRLLAAQKILAKEGIDFKYDVAIGDEAHHLALSDNKLLSSLSDSFSKWLFFTATRRIGIDGAFVGMNKKELFGEVIFSITAKKLQQAGIIVLFKLRIIKAPKNSEIKSILKKKDPGLVEDYRMMGALIKCIAVHLTSRIGKAARVLVFNESVKQAHGFAESNTIREYFPEPEWWHGAVSSLARFMQGLSKNDIYGSFKNWFRSTLQQYGMIKEGTSINGITLVVFLREINAIGLVQAIGRALRLFDVDRKNLKEGTISVNSPVGWDKAYGEIIVVLEADEQEDFKNKVKDVVKKLLEGGYERGDVEFVEAEDTKSKDDKKKVNVIPEFAPVVPIMSMSLFETEDVRSIVEQCYEEIERENAEIERENAIDIIKNAVKHKVKNESLEETINLLGNEQH